MTNTVSLSLDAALADLPAKPRVHELARRSGLTSKDVIAALAERGVEVKAASSSVELDVATALLTALLGAESAPTAAEAAPAAATVAEVPVLQAPGDLTAALFLAPVEVAPPRRRRKPAAKDPVESVDTVPAGAAETIDPTAAEQQVAGDSDLPVDAASEQDGEKPRGRRRGRGRGRGAAGESAGEAPEAETREATGSPETAAVADGDAAQADDASGGQTAGADTDGEDGDSAGRRRRRRGRRGRGRVSGDGTPEGDDEESTEDGAASTSDDAESGDSAGDGNGPDSGDETSSDGSRRRRRRRKRSGSDDGERDDDPDNTVVHVREPKSAASEVQGIRGSTRLEAKRQRRRDSRGSSRRPQILTEAEFLARREAVNRVMAVRERGELAQVALLEDGVLVEHFVSRAGSASMIGNVYLGRVQNVLPSMEAAFVDIGRGRNAVLYAGEVNWDITGLVGKARRIETALSSGDTVLVQVSKDPVGHKGARLTTQISLPGRFLVYVPGGGATGISRKLPDTERKRLKAILDRIVPDDAGVIIRTAAEGVPEAELARDVERLKAQWDEISQAAENGSNAPLQLSSEPDTLIKVIRDLFNSDINQLVVDGEQAWGAIDEYVSSVAPELADRVSQFDRTGSRDVFSAYRIDEQIAKALERKVHLPSGGSLVIDRTEAMTVVDVNTGKYTGSGGNLEETVTKNNLEAAEEIVRQLRLRDIGGIIVVDFIDMVLESNRDLVLRRLTECLGRDRTRHQVAEVTSLGLVQMTRKRMGTGLVEAFSEQCSHCGGRGVVLHDVPVDTSGGGEPAAAGEGKSGRNRRGRGKRAEEAEPVVKVASIPSVRPDPRGPKPPSLSARAGSEDPTVEGVDGDAPAAVEAADVDAVSGDAAASVQHAAQTSGDDAARADASQAVAAVAAAEAASGTQRRGRRAAGRPAGAPTAAVAVDIIVPAQGVSGAAAALTESASAGSASAGAQQVAAELTHADQTQEQPDTEQAPGPRKRSSRGRGRGKAGRSDDRSEQVAATTDSPSAAPQAESVSAVPSAPEVAAEAGSGTSARPRRSRTASAKGAGSARDAGSSKASESAGEVAVNGAAEAAAPAAKTARSGRSGRGGRAATSAPEAGSDSATGTSTGSKSASDSGETADAAPAAKKGRGPKAESVTVATPDVEPAPAAAAPARRRRSASRPAGPAGVEA